MKWILILTALVLSGCSHKVISKNCTQAGTTEYYVCDSLNITGK